MKIPNLPRYGIYNKLTLSIVFAAILLFFRIGPTHSFFYTFLVWNLFLATIPYFISQFMFVKFKEDRLSKWGFWVGLFCWQLFLPNSPYMITDLIHLPDGASHLLWLDLFLIFVFAVNGLLLGLLSLMDIYTILKVRFTDTIASPIILLCCLLSGYGMYVGRFNA
tara:strand:+ start:1861 stop:2355 length:495 start_codon:yes stop_codon:yes gene_type:complete